MTSGVGDVSHSVPLLLGPGGPIHCAPEDQGPVKAEKVKLKPVSITVDLGTSGLPGTRQ